jgi:L-ascorbate metabolism protein UlaG (beta-lactamase superfamily)
VIANHPRGVKRGGGPPGEDPAMVGKLTWLGHATVLIELGGVRMITDPLLRARVVHLRREAAVPGDVGRLDAILLSHAHHDHLDPKSLRRIDPDVPVVAPPAAVRSLRRSGRTVHTLAVGEELELAGVSIEAVAAVHDGRRVPYGRPMSGVGFMVGGVYFAGDTEPYAEMQLLAGRVDAALLPISGWGPKTGPGHMDPREAAQALRLLQPAMAVPIHWGTYRRIGHTPRGDPAAEFQEHAARLAPDVRLAILQPGGSVEITRAG